MKTLRRFALGIAALLTLVACGTRTKKAAIRHSVERQMSIYPRSTLHDLYKHFFQDFFGPGHLVADPAAAGKYLRSELRSCDTCRGPLYEPTGYRGNFYRVNLSVVKEGTIPYRTYFDAFVRSVDNIKPLSIPEWIKEWQIIESVIDEMDLGLLHYEEDKGEIAGLLREGKYVMHHSPEFSEAYEPHYRIFEKKIFEKEILPLLLKNK